MTLFQERVQEQCTLREHNQQEEQANISSDDTKELLRTKFLTLDVKMKVCSTVFAENLLGSYDLCCDAVCMLVFMLALTRVYKP